MRAPSRSHRSRSRGIAVGRALGGVLLAAVLAYVGYVAIALGPGVVDLGVADLVRGEARILHPAERRGAPLRRADRLYLLTTQEERIVPLWTRPGYGVGPPRELLHVDVWAFDAATAQPVWRRRLRTFEGRGSVLFSLLGLDGDTLWLMVREPLGISTQDGRLVVDGPGLEARNPPLAGRRVDEPGYVAFGAQGLQLTLSDATQWVVDGRTFGATPRASAPRRDTDVAAPARDASTAAFQLRGLAIPGSWIGVLTDEEAARYQAPPVIPGRTPGERPGLADAMYARDHHPQRLEAEPKPYRLWRARVRQVSAAPPEWPKDFPDRWGTRHVYDAYAVLPESPPFLQAGLLSDGGTEQAVWLREPDSVLVLHHDKVGGARRVRLTRVAGPGGRVVWDAGLGLGDVASATRSERTLVFVGSEPNPAHDPESPVSRERHEKVVVVDPGPGTTAVFDLTAESVREDGAGPPG